MTTNFIMNGQGHGQLASLLVNNNFDPNVLRPFIGDDGNSYINMNQGYDPDGKPQLRAIQTNAVATLMNRDWVAVDTAVNKAAKQRLNGVADMRAKGLVKPMNTGMSKTVIEHQATSDITPAHITMDGINRSETDAPEKDLKNIPLPIISKDWSLSAREVMVSRNTPGQALDTESAELAGRRVAEEAEALLFGTRAAYQYGGGSVYGFLNYPDRMAKALTAPTTANHPTTVAEVLAMRKQSTDAGYYGPWTLYYSPAWYVHMDEDYRDNGNNTTTLRRRLEEIEGITLKPADYLTGTTLLLKQDTMDVAKMVIPMDLITVQWESHGGMEFNFKTMAIMVPLLRSDFYGKTGIVHGAV